MIRPHRFLLAVLAVASGVPAYDTPFLTTADMQVYHTDTHGLVRSDGGPALFSHDRIDGVSVDGRVLPVLSRGAAWVQVDLPGGEHSVEVTLRETGARGNGGIAPPPAAGTPVSTASDFAGAVRGAVAGGEVVVANGVYEDWRVTVDSGGTADQPLTVRPQTPGGVTFRLHCELRIRADHVVFRGFRFEHCERTVLRIEGGSHNRVTQCQFLHCGSPTSTFGHICSIYPRSHHNRVDHCYWTGSKSMSLGIRNPSNQGDVPTYNRLDHNVFRDVFRIWINGQENIQLGQGSNSHHALHTRVEYNLFHNAWGDGEIFSNKSSHNTFRHNVAAHCPRSAFTLRGGSHATVDGNLLIGNNNGIRIFDCDHAITNNLIRDSRSTAVVFFSHGQGVPPQRVLLAHNTLLDNGGGIAAGVLNGDFRDNRVVGNIFASGRGTFIPETLAPHIEVGRNLVHATGAAVAGLAATDAVTADPLLDGAMPVPGLRPASPAIDAAPTLEVVRHDLFARPRPVGKASDFGAEEFGSGPADAVRRLMPLVPEPRSDDIDHYKRSLLFRGNAVEPATAWETRQGVSVEDGVLTMEGGAEARLRVPLPAGAFIAHWEYRPAEFASTAAVRLGGRTGDAGYRIVWGGVAEDGRPAGLIRLEKNGTLIARSPDPVLLRRNYIKSKGWPGERWGVRAAHPNPELWYRFRLVLTHNRLVVTLNRPRLTEKGTPRDDWFLPVLVCEDAGVIAGALPDVRQLALVQGGGEHGGVWRGVRLYEYGYVGDIPPPAPADVQASATRPHVVALKWSLPPTAPESVTVDIHRGPGPDFEPAPRNRVGVRVGGAFYEDVVAAGGAYTYKVRSVNVLGVASRPVTVQARTPPGDTCWLIVRASEAAAVVAPLQVDEDPVTSEPFLWAPPGSGSRMEGPGDDGVATFVVDIPRAGEYHIWSDVNCIDSGHDSFYVSSPSIADGKPMTHYTTPRSRWLWDLVPTGGPVRLAAGSHTIRYHLREDETRLRRFVVTSDLEWRPRDSSAGDAPAP